MWIEGWSSLLYILKSMGFTNIYIIKHENAWCAHAVVNHFAIEQWNIEYLTDWMKLNSNSDLLFLMEGSGLEVSLWLSDLKASGIKDVSIGVILKRRVRSYNFCKRCKWKKLHHHMDLVELLVINIE